MIRQCPECGNKDLKRYDENDIEMLCCKKCGFCWADYKSGEVKKSKPTEINPQPKPSNEPYN